MAEQVTQLLPVDDGVPKWAGIYRFNEEWLRPELSASFPAHLLESPLEWRDLVLDTGVMAQIEELHTWLKYGNTLMDEWQLAKKVKPPVTKSGSCFLMKAMPYLVNALRSVHPTTGMPTS